MKNKLQKVLLSVAASFLFFAALGQNVSINMLVLNSGIVPVSGNGTLKATINASTGSAGQTTPVPSGKINLSITVPPSLSISSTQNNIPAGWTVRNNDGTVINLCNSSTTIPVNTAIDIMINLQGVTATSGSPTMSGQISFKTNCTAPGSLSGDNPSDNIGQAGFIVTGVVPVKLTNFNASLNNCEPLLKWTTENEINSDRFEIERSVQANSGWTTVAAVPASGTSDTKRQYSYIDKDVTALTGKIFYRLKIIDKNGQYAYSEILPLLINCKTILLQVYPNPVSRGAVFINVAGIEKPAEANLISVVDQVVLKSKITNGVNKLNIINIADGEYILQVNFENGVSKKVKVLVDNN